MFMILDRDIRSQRGVHLLLESRIHGAGADLELLTIASESARVYLSGVSCCRHGPSSRNVNIESRSPVNQHVKSAWNADQSKASSPNASSSLDYCSRRRNTSGDLNLTASFSFRKARSARCLSTLGVKTGYRHVSRFILTQSRVLMQMRREDERLELPAVIPDLLRVLLT